MFGDIFVRSRVCMGREGDNEFGEVVGLGGRVNLCVRLRSMFLFY